MGLCEAEDPKELPEVSVAPSDKPLPRVGHSVVSVNGYLLAGSADTYLTAIELISTSGRPVTIGFRARQEVSDNVSGAAVSGTILSEASMEGLSPLERANLIFDIVDANKNGGEISIHFQFSISLSI